jgi:lipopolysaccharide/colanic/teichoic acid biosynthesis glycosyltransferase
VRRLIAAFPGGWGTIEPTLRRKLERAGYKLDDGAEVYERLTGRLPLQALQRAAVGFRADGGLRGTALAGKRVVDSVLASLLLAALIRLDSPGPAIFRQQRVGRHGRLFTLYKFRSMRVNADAGGPARPAGKNDARCTRLGRWLRRLRLDELPQLWNIVRGDMSLVGPRPFVPEQEEEYRHAIPFYEQRWAVLPGATGWAQVNRAYCATLDDNADKLAYDLFYIRNLSLLFDLLILMQTFKVVFFGRGGR